mmetsp:Transcript_137781/g.428108  ORF Transcript_137781/g.428108 Transcript_137781/m.428108 type:complete len:246 (-) Transcript_137781:960-1697(-)
MRAVWRLRPWSSLRSFLASFMASFTRWWSSATPPARAFLISRSMLSAAQVAGPTFMASLACTALTSSRSFCIRAYSQTLRARRSFSSIKSWVAIFFAFCIISWLGSAPIETALLISSLIMSPAILADSGSAFWLSATSFWSFSSMASAMRSVLSASVSPRIFRQRTTSWWSSRPMMVAETCSRRCSTLGSVPAFASFSAFSAHQAVACCATVPARLSSRCSAGRPKVLEKVAKSLLFSSAGFPSL